METSSLVPRREQRYDPLELLELVNDPHPPVAVRDRIVPPGSYCAEADGTARRAPDAAGTGAEAQSPEDRRIRGCPRIVHQALQVIGILGYTNDTPYSVGRHYRDVLSVSLMVSNARIASKNASMLLVYREN